MQPTLSISVPPVEDPHQAILAELKTQLGERKFERWFSNRTILNIQNDQLTVGVASPFLLTWMQNHFRPALLAAAQSVIGPSARIRFEVDERAGTSKESNGQRPHPSPLAADSSVGVPAGRPNLGTSISKSSSRPSRRRFASLDAFVEGDCNRLPLTAARQACDLPGSHLNPLYLHGGVGTGKTHLLEGIYQQIRRQFPSLQVLFITSEGFANYFTLALREHTLPSFRQRFRSVDVLLVDDVDFLDAKRVIQEEFLHTFQQLMSHGRQVVMTADRHPRLLSKLSDELTTRFLSGMVCRLESPDLATRHQVVKQYANGLKGDFSPDALEFVAKRFQNNFRELEGAVNCLQTYFSMTKRRITVTTARRVLADLERDCIRIIRIDDIEQAVCNLFRLQPKDLKSARRLRSVCQPRMLAMFLARKHTQAAYSEIGQFFGGRNHSTVMSAEKKVQNWIDQQQSIEVSSHEWLAHDLVDAIEQQLLAS